MCLRITVNFNEHHELCSGLVKLSVYDTCFTLFHYNETVVLFVCVFGCCLHVYTLHFLTGKQQDATSLFYPACK